MGKRKGGKLCAKPCEAIENFRETGKGEKQTQKIRKREKMSRGSSSAVQSRQCSFLGIVP